MLVPRKLHDPSPMTTPQPSYDEMRRLLLQARDIVAETLNADDHDRSVPPRELLKAAVSHMTPEEEDALAEEAYRIVSRAGREFKRYMRRNS